MNALTRNTLGQAALLAILGFCACRGSAFEPSGDAAVDTMNHDTGVLDSAIDLGYPDWVFVGLCDDPPLLEMPILDASTAPNDGMEHTWIAGFPGSAYSEADMQRQHRCVLRRAKALGMRYVGCYLLANAISVSGTLDQALELSRDARLEQMAVSSASGL